MDGQVFGTEAVFVLGGGRFGTVVGGPISEGVGVGASTEI